MHKKLVEINEKYDLSVWLDNVDRAMLSDGSLQHLIDIGARGLTSNPSIFEKAISSGQYTDQIKSLKGEGLSNEDIYWQIALEDIGKAADLFKPVYDVTNGNDGFVSLEVSPLLARDTTGTIKQAMELWTKLGKKNAMIKVPATQEGLPAISELLAQGININVTLIFGPDRYQDVLNAFVEGISRCHDSSKVRSVASVFVSRVDSLIDSKLPQDSQVRGKAGVAQSLQCYKNYQDLFDSGEHHAWNLAKIHGATAQRPLWASTSTKDPGYDTLMYVKNLLTPNSVNTIPSATLDLLIDSNEDWPAFSPADITQANATIESLSNQGINFIEVYKQLEDEGVDKFNDAFRQLLEVIAST